MKRFFQFAGLFLALAVPCGVIESESSNVTNSRDLAKYDTAGPYDFATSDWTARSRWQKEIRKFIWTHWRERLLGCLHAKYYTKEGDSTATIYYIEPDEKGVWHICLEEDTDFGGRFGEPRRIGRQQYSIYKVVRTKGKNNRESVLELIDAKGKAIREL